MTSQTRQRILLLLTLLEGLFFGIYIYTCVATSDYVFEIALEDFTQPWLGSHVSELDSKYNVQLMKNMMILGDCMLVALGIANLVRFVFLAKKYKIVFGIGLGCGLLGYLLAITDDYNLSGVYLILLLISCILFIYSHWLGKAYKEQGDRNKNNIENKAM